MIGLSHGAASMAARDDIDWMPVIAKSLAHLCLTRAEMRDESMLTQARFLEGLGLPRREVAQMLGTTVDSLGAQKRNERKRRKVSRGSAKKGQRGR
jgi:hypothetical protein